MGVGSGFLLRKRKELGWACSSVVTVVEYLLSTDKVLGSMPSTTWGLGCGGGDMNRVTGADALQS